MSSYITSIANLHKKRQIESGRRENRKMISEGFFLIPWKEASLIGPEQLFEHLINHSIITRHQSILTSAVVINSEGDNPLIAGYCWELGLDDNLIQIVFEAQSICKVWVFSACVAHGVVKLWFRVWNRDLQQVAQLGTWRNGWFSCGLGK